MPEKISPISLSQISMGEAATLLSLNNGQMVNSRLTSMGFTPGVKVEMLQNLRQGPLIVVVRGARVALGRVEAANIIVAR